ncbi:DUF4856 domain-containing protein [Tenacibaculum sp. M341]|uniref:DUF4856 domain-containing protein n=1 Tax=Tenacibaculum sp. M341 TaxID=2530339 RepID=UPI001050C87D|nr:DUF4856 domain-containing protein [Tenacibaculum sp. M341]TCI90723.1 DUF4856 domain-containing protein [Tenacibaculum sp. M341]
MKKNILSLFVLGAILASCSDDTDGGITPDPGTTVSTPKVSEVITGTDFSRGDDGDYNNDYINNYKTLFTREGEATVSFSGQTTRLKQAKEIGSNLKSETSVADIREKFEGVEVGGELQSAGFSDASLNGTTKVVRPKSSSSIGIFGSDKNTSGQGKTNVEAIDAFITKHQDVLDNWTATAAAGQAGSFLESDGTTRRYVNKQGLELDQLFTKSMAGALAYDQAVNHYLNRLDNENGDDADGAKDYRALNDAGTVAEGKSYTTMEHHWDESFGYIYGNTSAQNLIYKYIDNVAGLPKFTGLESDIFTAFVKGRIAIVEKNYTERDTQVKVLREKLGLVIAVRAVHYLIGGAEIISEAAAPGATKKREDAFHDLCEGYGFVNSLRYVVNANGDRYFTDADVDGFISILTTGDGLWDVTPTQLTDMADAIAGKSVGGISWTVEDVNP